MILNCKKFYHDNHDERLINFVNRKGIPMENIRAILPDNSGVVLYWWADNYDYDDEEDW